MNGNNELSYEEFLKALNSIPREEFNKPKKKPIQQIFEEICLDFPLLSLDELQTLKETLLTQMKNNSHELIEFPLSSRFIEGIKYGAQNLTGKESLLETKLYQDLCIIIFIRLFKRILKLKDKELITYLFREFEIENENMTETKKELSWNEVEIKLNQLATNVSYELIAQSNLWNDFSLIEEILDIIELLQAEEEITFLNSKNLFHIIPWYFFLLRDRMLDVSDSIPTLLPPCLRLFDLESEKTIVFYQQIIISLLGALTTLKKLNPVVCQTILQQIDKNLGFFGRRLQQLTDSSQTTSELYSIFCILEFYVQNSLLDKLKSKDELVEIFIKWEIFRNLIQNFIKNNSESTLLSPGKRLLFILIIHSDKFFTFAETTQEFINSIQFQTNVVESVIWKIILGLYSRDHELYIQSACEIFYCNVDSIPNWTNEFQKLNILFNILKLLELIKINSPLTLSNQQLQPFLKKLRSLQSTVHQIKLEQQEEIEAKLDSEKQDKKSLITSIKFLMKNILQEGKAD